MLLRRSKLRRMNMSWKKDASMYILSKKISAPIATNVDPDIKEEYFLKKVNIFDFKFTFDENIGNKINGIANPKE